MAENEELLKEIPAIRSYYKGSMLKTVEEDINRLCDAVERLSRQSQLAAPSRDAVIEECAMVAVARSVSWRHQHPLIDGIENEHARGQLQRAEEANVIAAEIRFLKSAPPAEQPGPSEEEIRVALYNLRYPFASMDAEEREQAATIIERLAVEKP